MPKISMRNEKMTSERKNDFDMILVPGYTNSASGLKDWSQGSALLNRLCMRSVG